MWELTSLTVTCRSLLGHQLSPGAAVLPAISATVVSVQTHLQGIWVSAFIHEQTSLELEETAQTAASLEGDRDLLLKGLEESISFLQLIQTGALQINSFKLNVPISQKAECRFFKI